MTVRANNDETLRNQLPSVSKCWIALSAVRPWIALTFWLLLIECCLFHSAAERAIMPCRKSHRRNLQEAVLRVGIILPKIRGPAQFLNTQSAQKTLIFYYKRCCIIVPPHIQTGNHQRFVIGKWNNCANTPRTNQGTSAHRSVIMCHYLALLRYIAVCKNFGFAGCIYAAHRSGGLNSP